MVFAAGVAGGLCWWPLLVAFAGGVCWWCLLMVFADGVGGDDSGGGRCWCDGDGGRRERVGSVSGFASRAPTRAPTRAHRHADEDSGSSRPPTAAA
jgi:hypothetical protein